MVIAKIKLCDFCENPVLDDWRAFVSMNRKRKDVCKKCLMKIQKKKKKSQSLPEQPERVETKPLDINPRRPVLNTKPMERFEE